MIIILMHKMYTNNFVLFLIYVYFIVMKLFMYDKRIFCKFEWLYKENVKSYIYQLWNSLTWE